MGDIRHGHWACRERISLGVGNKWLSKMIVLLFFSFLFLLAHSEREEQEYFKKLKTLRILLGIIGCTLFTFIIAGKSDLTYLVCWKC